MLTANVSHELKTPLNCIISFISVLISKIKRKDQQ